MLSYYGKLMVKVSLYMGYDHPVPERSIWLPEFLTKTSPLLDMYLLNVRSAPTKESAKRWKRKLPAVTVSGEFSRRCTEGLIRHTGLICLDFDDCDVNVTKHLLSLLPYVAFAGESASGKGVFAIVPISRPDMHREHFDALRDEMERKGLLVDGGCSDISRLRGFSHDEDAYFNPNAETWSKVKRPEVAAAYTSYSRGSDEERFLRLLEMIEGMGIDITNSRSSWTKIGMAIASTFGESGRGYWHRISRFYNKYKPYEADKQYDSFLRHGYNRASLSSVFWIAKQYGVMLNERRR